MFEGRKIQFWLAFIVILGTVAWTYGKTIAPTVQGFDSAELTVGAYTLGLIHPTGYPLYMLIGHLAENFLWGDVGFRLNLLSAGLGVATTMLFFTLIAAQTKSAFTAGVVALLYALTPHVWSQSIKAEVYSLHTLLMVVTMSVWFVANRMNKPAFAILYFAIIGLASANHATSILLGVALLFCTDWRDKRWRASSFTGIAVGVCIALTLYLYFPWRSEETSAINYLMEYFGRDFRHPADLLWLVSGQAFRCAVKPAWSLPEMAVQITRLGAFLWDGSLGLAPLLGIWGWKTLQSTSPRWNRLLSIFFLFNVGFFFVYQVVDKEAMFLPVYLIMDLWIAQGVLACVRWLPTHIPRLNQAKSSLLSHLVLLGIIGTGVVLDWHSVDLSQDRQVHQYASQVLQELRPETIIVNHWVTASVFDYLRVVEEVRPDVQSFNLDFFFLGAHTSCQPAQDADPNAPWFTWLETKRQKEIDLCFIEPLPAKPETFDWVKVGLCWQLEPWE